VGFFLYLGLNQVLDVCDQLIDIVNEADTCPLLVYSPVSGKVLSARSAPHANKSRQNERADKIGLAKSLFPATQTEASIPLKQP